MDLLGFIRYAVNSLHSLKQRFHPIGVASVFSELTSSPNFFRDQPFDHVTFHQIVVVKIIHSWTPISISHCSRSILCTRILLLRSRKSCAVRTTSSANLDITYSFFVVPYSVSPLKAKSCLPSSIRLSISIWVIYRLFSRPMLSLGYTMDSSHRPYSSTLISPVLYPYLFTLTNPECPYPILPLPPRMYVVDIDVP